MFWKPAESTGPRFRTQPATRADFVVAINSTGTIEPEEVVDVGAQVAGRIVEFGKEVGAGRTIDYTSRVKPGTVLALIDDSLYKEEANQARAESAKARALLEQTQTTLKEVDADVARAKADLKQMQARLHQAERDWGRAQQLIKTNVVSQQEFDTYQANYEIAAATIGVGEAAVVQAESRLSTQRAAVVAAQAEVDRAQASLNRAEKNLGYTTIVSPIEGVIIDRRVNIGQTVVASLNAPSLFLIAKDLRRMQVWASVNEADIGRIKKGQKVTFNVDTFPGEAFAGVVSQIRLNASMTQNVVTYTVVVDADNSQERLLPYLTANLKFEVTHRPSALVVPNAALRWKPREDQIAPEFRGQAPSAGKVFVWTAADGFVRPVETAIGLTDGTQTEVLGGSLQEGEQLVVGEIKAGADTSTVNPFAPKVYSGRKDQ